VLTQVAFSPDGEHLVSSSMDQTVKVWNVAGGKETFTFEEEAAALSAAFSPDGLRVASGSADHTVKLWERPANGSRTLGAGKVQFRNVVFSPDGRRIAGAGPQIVIWDAISGKVSLSLEHRCLNGRVAWSPDGRHAAIGPTIWDLPQGTISLQMKESPSLSIFVAEATWSHHHEFHYGILGAGTAFSGDGKLLAAVVNPGNVCVWNVVTEQLLHRITVPSFAVCVAFSRDGKLLAVGSALQRGTALGLLQLWDLATGQVSLIPDGYLPGVLSVAFSPDGRRIAAAVSNYVAADKSRGGEVRVWDVATGQQIWNFRGHSGCVWSVSFSPDGKRIASAGGKRNRREPGEAKIWDLQTGQDVCTLRGHTGAVFGVSFSPDGRHLATASADGTVRIWDGTPLASAPDDK
jgi:WD40 repeat protein